MTADADGLRTTTDDARRTTTNIFLNKYMVVIGLLNGVSDICYENQRKLSTMFLAFIFCPLARARMGMGEGDHLGPFWDNIKTILR